MKKSSLILLLLFIAGFIVRIIFLPQGALTFSYDQGRDAFVAHQILSGDLKIQGPPSSTPGLYHGVFYYYLLAPLYFLGQGNPVYPSLGLAVINSLGIPLIYLFSKRLFKNESVSLALSGVYAFSFEQSQYAVWLSNPTYASFTIPLFYFSLFSWMRKKPWAPLVSGVALGLSVQAEVFLLYHLPVLAFLLITRQIRATWEQVMAFTTLFIFAVLPMVISQIKFGFTALSGLSTLLLGKSPAQFTDAWYYYLNLLGRTLANNIFPLNVSVGGLFGLGLIIWFLIRYWSKSEGKLLSLYVLSSAFAAPFGGIATPFLNVGLGLGIYLMAGFALVAIKKTSPILFGVIFCLILVSNLISIVKYNSHGQTIFALQPSLTLSHELAAIDYIYSLQSGRDFSINTITSPLYINTAWSYLFNWYGQSKYGYLPAWHGHSQVNLLGDTLLSPRPHVTDYYLIVDPPEPNFAKFIAPGIAEEDGFSQQIQSQKFGEITVQQRTRI